MSTRRFRLAPGTELVTVAEGRYTLRSEFDAVEMTGEAAVDFAEKVITELHIPRSMKDISTLLPEYAPASVTRQIEALVKHGLVVEVSSSTEGSQIMPFTAFIESTGLNADETAARLGSAKVAVFGLEAHGAHLAQMMGQIGIGQIRLIDPFPMTEVHLTLTPVIDPRAIGLSRQQAVASMMGLDEGRIEIGPKGELSEALVRELIEDCDLVFSCWDQSYAAASHWVNRAAQENGVPVLFGELRATATFAGPLFLPHRSACWMCFRMRSIACARDFEQAIAFEEHLDRARMPRLANRPILPMLPNQLASTIGLEALRHLIGIHPPVLVDHVVEYDAIRNATIEHPVLVKPDCPVCSKKKKRNQPSFNELVAAESTSIDTPDLVRLLVDQRTGVISQFGAVPKDLTEPPIPLVWRATVSNHRFFDEHDEERATCSGKGISEDEAWISCLGEAIERYSGACWDIAELKTARYAELDGRALDPRELVLYRDEQYENLPYTPYDEDTELSWLKARSLINGDEVWVPAIAALMDYSPRNQKEFLFPITSNGLAAGPSLHEAVLNAISEVLERDAFLLSWLHRLPGHQFTSSEHPHGSVRRLARLYERRGVHLALIHLTTDHPMSVFVGMALQDNASDGPSATVGLGAAMNPVDAARKAALEVGQVRPSIRRRARLVSPDRVQELASNPLDVKTMEDHALLYAHPSTIKEFDFLFGHPLSWTEQEPTDTTKNLGTMLRHFREVEQDVLYVNLTPPDMEKLGIYTVRAIIPGYQPIWFGRGERRLGGRRLFEFPVVRDLRDAASNPAELNPMPHPIA